jgi:hypothetical protein
MKNLFFYDYQYQVPLNQKEPQTYILSSWIIENNKITNNNIINIYEFMDKIFLNKLLILMIIDIKIFSI